MPMTSLARARAILRRYASRGASRSAVTPADAIRLSRAAQLDYLAAPGPAELGRTPDPFASLVAESEGNPDSTVMARFPPIAAGSARDPSAKREGYPVPVRCGACRLLTTSPRSARLHRTRTGGCYDPATEPTRGGKLRMHPAYVTPDGRIVWGWPQGATPAALPEILAWLTSPEWAGPDEPRTEE